MIAERFPDHAVLGEEFEQAGQRDQIPEYCWVFDPIDGTTNYAHGLPIFCWSSSCGTSVSRCSFSGPGSCSPPHTCCYDVPAAVAHDELVVVDSLNVRRRPPSTLLLKTRPVWQSVEYVATIGSPATMSLAMWW